MTNPSLPQNDPNKTTRQNQLNQAKTIYQWTTSVVSLPGVPMAASVPDTDTPTPSWFIDAGGAQAATKANDAALAVAGAFTSETLGQPMPIVSINCGASVKADQFLSDAFYSSESLVNSTTHSITINSANAPHAANSKVYQTERYGSNFNYTIPGLQANKGYIVRLHFCEIYFQTAHSRVFSVTINGVSVIQNLDLYARYGAFNAVVLEFSCQTDNVGQILIALLSSVNNATICGVEIQQPAPVVAHTLDEYQDQFITLSAPLIVSRFSEDEIFAYMRLAGPNPMLIENITSMPAKFPLTDAQYQVAMGSSDTVSKALSDKRMFFVDFAPLAGLTNGSVNGQVKRIYAPMAVFARPHGSNNLKPVAIRCTQDASAPVFTPCSTEPGKWAWEMAKTVVQVADANFHEAISHLSRTHLVMEAFTVATHRSLAMNHPIYMLLVPHFEGTLSINDRAATGLIAQNGPIDLLFASPIAQLQQMVANDRCSYNWANNQFPHDISARKVGTDTLPTYPYRDDAQLIWTAISNWVQSYVDVYYGKDSDVSHDTELQAWVTELQGSGKIAGLPQLNTKSNLEAFCTGVIFIATAQHAAVNFPQWDHMAYAPAFGGAAWAEAPANGQIYSQQNWLSMIAPISMSKLQIDTLYVLGNVHYGTIDEYESNSFPYSDWFGDSRVNTPLKNYRDALKVVENTIKERNATRMLPYPYFQPSLIPSGINI